MTAAMRMMNHPGPGAYDHFIAQQSQPSAYIYVFVIKKITLVKPTHPCKDSARKQQEHSASPIRTDWLIFNHIVITFALTKRLANYFERGRKTPDTVFNFAVLTQHNRGRHSDRQILKTRNQGGERINIEADVRIHHTKKAASSFFECLIMILTKTSRAGISKDSEREWIVILREGQFFREIEGENDFHGPDIAMSGYISKQLYHQSNLPMADNRNSHQVSH
jgi:hypothetical protein